jgi:hypothetical protein
MRSYLAGFVTSPSSTTGVTIGSGVCADISNTSYIVGSGITKLIGATWAAGAGNGGRVGIAAPATGATFHVFVAIINGVFDAFMDSSVTGINAPAGTTALRRVGSIVMSSGTAIRPWTQWGDEFLWQAASSDASGVGNANANVNITLNVPNDVVVMARCRLWQQGDHTNGVGGTLLVRSVDESGTLTVSPGTNNPSLITEYDDSGVEIMVRTNSTRQVVMRSTVARNFQVDTFGWLDVRDRLS